LFRVADPECIPGREDNCRIALGDEMGVQVTLPSAWLFAKFEKPKFRSRSRGSESRDLPRTLIDSVRIALRPHLHETDLTVEKAAELCGHKRRSLARQLRANGTTLSHEIAKLRAARAERDLAETNLRVAEIAQRVGFRDPTVFSRAFKSWTGQSPSAFRMIHQSRGTQE
jgi:AraC-like DNA-binding protein